MSYTSHGDLLGGLVGSGKIMTKESQLRCRSMRNAPPATTNSFFEITHKAHRGDYVSCKTGKLTCGMKHNFPPLGWSHRTTL